MAEKLSRSKSDGGVARLRGAAASTVQGDALSGRLSGFVEPQLCELVDLPPKGGAWIHEVKFDGYRMQMHVEKGEVRIYTRNGYDWTPRFPKLVKSAEKLESCILDGELCAVDANGVSDFPDLVSRLDAGRSDPLVFFAFDCLRRRGRELRLRPLLHRKEQLLAVLRNAPPSIRYVTHLTDTGGADLLTAACQSNLEGIVSKAVTSSYRAGKTGCWLKSKCRPAQEVVIGGWTEEASGGFRSLLVGVYEGRDFVYAGKVGTGFGGRKAQELKSRLESIEAASSPFARRAPTSPARVRWAKPKLVAHIEFAGWTSDRQVRQASFKALREDKLAKAVVRELA